LSSSVSMVLVCVLFVFVALLTAFGVVVVRRWKKLNKCLQMPHLVSSSAGLRLAHIQSSVVENVYQMEEGASEYESCP
ncbi:hypothetical protein LDENG_00240320, partial [Lucifuga dentata]